MPDEEELNQWILEKAFDVLGEEATAEFFAGERSDTNGIDAVTEALFEELLIRLYEHQNEQGHPARGFNELSDDWPRGARGLLAGFEYRDDDNDEKGEWESSYESELHYLAEQNDCLQMTFEQTELSCFYNENPFEDERLSDEEARLVLLLRTLDEDVSPDIIEDISDYDSFMERLDETEDVYEAISAHLYSEVLPVDVTRRLPSPSEWPDELDPRDVEEELCVVCSNPFFEVYGPNERIEYVGGGGSTISVYDVTHDDDSEYYPHRADHSNGILCERCASNHHSESADWIRVGEGNLTSIKWGREVYSDSAAQSDIYSPFEVVREMDPLFEEMVRNGTRAVSDEIVRITPNPEVGDRVAQQDLLQQIKDGNIEEAIDEETFYIHHNHHAIQGDSWVVLVRRTDLQSARKVKSMLEEPGEFIRA